jgi:pyruvate/2-oxoglutarate dehydrogenase complex dihydrolipoamide acyltransferase (E2) component
MSDKLAELIVVAAQAITAHVNKSAQTGGGARPTVPAKPAAQQAAKPVAPAAKPAAPAVKPAAPAAKPAAPAAKPAVKPAAKPAQVGQHSLDDIRTIIKKVVATAGLGKETAVELLDTEGGVKKISDLKPADYDKVYEACDGALRGGEAGATGDAAAVEFDEDDPTA